MCCHCKSTGTFAADCDKFIPEFWTGDRYAGPMCNDCASRFCELDEGDEFVLKFRPIFHQSHPGLIIGYMEGIDAVDV